MLQNLALLLGLIGVGVLFGMISGHLIWNRSKEIATQQKALILQDRELRATCAKLEKSDAERLVLLEERKAAEAERDVSDLRATKLEAALAQAKEDALKLEQSSAAARSEKSAAEEKLDDELLRITALQSKLDELRDSEESLASQQSEIDAIIEAKVKAQNALADEMAQARRREDEVALLKTELLQAVEESKEQRTLLEAQASELADAKSQAARADDLERNLVDMTETAGLVPALQARVADLEDQMRSVAEASSELDSVLANLAVRDKLVADLRARSAQGSNTDWVRSPAASNGHITNDLGKKPSTLSAARNDHPDNLKRIKGVSPELESRLYELGVFHFDQIADWTSEEASWIDAQLGSSKSEATRDQWISQAKILAAGGETPFSARIAEEDIYRSA
ncbi:MAG: hypothetical protein AAGF55_08365 [Pseudomonadota bacterium]